MRISELSDRSGVAVATLKYYLRLGLLAPGIPVNARQSRYTEDHLVRIRLIRGLISVLGSSLDQVQQLLAVIDAPEHTPLEAMGLATAALPMSGAPTAQATAQERPRETSRAAAVLTRLGYRSEPDSPTVLQLEAALALAAGVGVDIDPAQLAVYGAAARSIAAADFARVPWGDPGAATAFAVLGTALYEPVLLALRRLAHAELASTRDGGQPRTPGTNHRRESHAPAHDER